MAQLRKMPLLRKKVELRKKPAPESVTLERERAGAKNRPTPKRQQARQARRSPVSSGDPKQAKAEARDARRRQTAVYREGMRSGDPSKLPAAERAPEKVLARDLVDRRFTIGPIFLAILALNLVGGLIPVVAVQRTVYFAMLAAFVLLAVDSVLIIRQVGSAVREAYPGSTVKVGGYAARRALMPLRFRMPRARVSRRGPR